MTTANVSLRPVDAVRLAAIEEHLKLTGLCVGGRKRSQSVRYAIAVCHDYLREKGLIANGKDTDRMPGSATISDT